MRMQACAVANRIQGQRNRTGTYERHTSSFVGSEGLRCLMRQGTIRNPEATETLVTEDHIAAGVSSSEAGNEVVSGLGPHSGDTEAFKACVGWGTVACMTLADENKIEAVWRLSIRMAPSQKKVEKRWGKQDPGGFRENVAFQGHRRMVDRHTAEGFDWVCDLSVSNPEGEAWQLNSLNSPPCLARNTRSPSGPGRSHLTLIGTRWEDPCARTYDAHIPILGNRGFSGLTGSSAGLMQKLLTSPSAPTEVLTLAGGRWPNVDCSMKDSATLQRSSDKTVSDSQPAVWCGGAAGSAAVLITLVPGPSPRSESGPKNYWTSWVRSGADRRTKCLELTGTAAVPGVVGRMTSKGEGSGDTAL
ncbi:hypothetical protein V8D89_008148 [Ganoderma adspersum]